MPFSRADFIAGGWVGAANASSPYLRRTSSCSRSNAATLIPPGRRRPGPSLRNTTSTLSTGLAGEMECSAFVRWLHSGKKSQSRPGDAPLREPGAIAAIVFHVSGTRVCGVSGSDRTPTRRSSWPGGGCTSRKLYPACFTLEEQGFGSTTSWTKPTQAMAFVRTRR